MMSFKFIVDFLKTKKGKALVVTVVGGGLVHFFPGSVDYIAEILAGISDNIQPAQ